MAFGAWKDVFGKGWGRHKILGGVVVFGCLRFDFGLWGIGLITAYGVTAESQKNNSKANMSNVKNLV
jgi:hypothetical protein